MIEVGSSAVRLSPKHKEWAFKPKNKVGVGFLAASRPE